MMLQVDARKIQVLLSVLQRAPATVAEQLVCEEVAALLIQLAEGQPQNEPGANCSPGGEQNVS